MSGQDFLGQMLPFDDSRHLAAQQFLVQEAYRQGMRDLESWFDMLAPDLCYRVPITSTFGAKPHKEGEMDHMHEDYYSIRMRIERLKTNMAWTENPASRTERLIANVACFETQKDEEVRVLSSFLIFRTQGDYMGPDLIAGSRDDILRETPDGIKLVSRVVNLQESVLRTQNLAIFL